MAQTQTGSGNRDTASRPAAGTSGVSSSGLSSSMGSDTTMSGTGARSEDSKFSASQITDTLKNVDVRGAMRDLSERGREYMTEGERYIRANPIPVVLSAVGVGFVLGFFMRRPHSAI